MRKPVSIYLVFVLFTFMAMLLSACSPKASIVQAVEAKPTDAQSLVKTTPSTNQAFTDPFAYCAAVGTIDTPDASYTGQAIPDEVILGYKKAAGLEASTMPLAMFQKTTIWRCMDGKVYACNFGANLPCSSKANTDKTPTQAMQDYCQANPDSDFIPMSVTGHSTIYSWHCVKDTPELLDQVDQVDAAGYLSRIWYAIGPVAPADKSPALPPADLPTPTATAATGAAIQPLTVEVCDGEAQAMAHALNVIEVTQADVPLVDPILNKSGTGCKGTITGTGVQFKSPDVPVKAFASMLVDEGWTEDVKLEAGGPTGMGVGYRKGNQICLADAIWQPDVSANCSKDQPISACNVKPEQQNYTITLLCGIENP